MKTGLPHPEARDPEIAFNKCNLFIRVEGCHIHGKLVEFHYFLSALQQRYIQVFDWKTGDIKVVSKPVITVRLALIDLNICRIE